MERIFKTFWILTLIMIPLGIITNTFHYVGIITGALALCIISAHTINYKLNNKS